jgi:hypothetical protein
MIIYFFLIKLALKLQRAGYFKMSKIVINLTKGF